MSGRWSTGALDADRSTSKEKNVTDFSRPEGPIREVSTGMKLADAAPAASWPAIRGPLPIASCRDGKSRGAPAARSAPARPSRRAAALHVGSGVAGVPLPLVVDEVLEVRGRSVARGGAAACARDAGGVTAGHSVMAARRSEPCGVREMDHGRCSLRRQARWAGKARRRGASTSGGRIVPSRGIWHRPTLPDLQHLATRCRPHHLSGRS